MITNSNLHHFILNFIIRQGHAPNLKILSDRFNTSEKAVIEGLYALQDYHGLVLHPNEPKIWVIHPFSLAPTPFVVESARGKWWGNCAWCSLGVAALLEEDVTITTSSGALGEKLKLHIVNGELQEKNLLIHFPIPMQKAWDNVIYTCSTMLVFRTEAEIDAWSERHNIPKGDVQRADKIWAFSQKWYGNHLDSNWQKWTVEEAKQLFEAFDLKHKVWQLEVSGERF